MEHFHRLRLVAGAGGEELVELCLRLGLGFRVIGTRQGSGASLRREQRRDVSKLAALDGEQLIAGLARLQAPSAPWLEDTSASTCARVVARFCTTPAWTFIAS